MVDDDDDFQTAGLLHVMEKLCSFDDFCALLSRGRMGFTPRQYSALKEMRNWSFDGDEQHDVQAWPNVSLPHATQCAQEEDT